MFASMHACIHVCKCMWVCKWMHAYMYIACVKCIEYRDTYRITLILLPSQKKITSLALYAFVYAAFFKLKTVCYEIVSLSLSETLRMTSATKVTGGIPPTNSAFPTLQKAFPNTPSCLNQSLSSINVGFSQLPRSTNFRRGNH